MLSVCPPSVHHLDHCPLPGQLLGTSRVSHGCHVPFHCWGLRRLERCLPCLLGRSVGVPALCLTGFPRSFNRHSLLSPPELQATTPFNHQTPSLRSQQHTRASGESEQHSSDITFGEGHLEAAEKLNFCNS